MPAIRLFVAVALDALVRARLEARAAQTRTRAPAARWADPAGFHLTLAFLGDQDDSLVPAIEAALSPVAARFSPLSLRVRGAGLFSSARKPRIRALPLSVPSGTAPAGSVALSPSDLGRPRVPG